MERTPDLRGSWQQAKAIIAIGLASVAMGGAPATATAEAQPHLPKTPTPEEIESPSSDATSPETAAPSYNAGSPLYGGYYYWVGGRVEAEATGASVVLEQTNPTMDAPAGWTGGHTLAELWVGTADSQQAVEIGWQRQGIVNTTPPRLFVAQWFNGEFAKCYADCGFVELPNASIGPSDMVEVGESAEYAIEHTDNKWLFSYNNQPIGYFPDTNWNGKFTSAGKVETYGEVFSPQPFNSTIDMGNGVFGSKSGSAKISDFHLINPVIHTPTPSEIICPPSTDPVALTPYATAPELYDFGSVTDTSLTYGGPGYTGVSSGPEYAIAQARGSRATDSEERTYLANPNHKLPLSKILPQDQPLHHFNVKSCLPMRDRNIHQMAQTILKRFFAHSGENGGTAYRSEDDRRVRLKIPTADGGLVVLSEATDKFTDLDNRPDPAALLSLRAAAYPNLRAFRRDKPHTSVIFWQEKASRSPDKPWKAYYEGYDNPSLNPDEVPEEELFTRLMVRSRELLRARAENP